MLPKHAEYQAFLRPACEPLTNHAVGRHLAMLVDARICSGLWRAPSGSRTRTFAMARRQAAATSWARTKCAGLSMNQEHREGLEPSSPHYGCGILAAGRPVPSITSVGPDGLEPSPAWLRARYAAANTLIPCVLFAPKHNRRGGNRTLGLVLIRDLLLPLSYAPSVGPKGLEPLLAGLKVRCAAVTPRPRNVGRAYAFQSRVVHAIAPRFQW